MELCDTCKQFDIQAFAPTKFQIRGYRLSAALAAAESGCEFCSLLVTTCLPDGRGQGITAWLRNRLSWIGLQVANQFGDRSIAQHEEAALDPSEPPRLAKLYVNVARLSPDFCSRELRPLRLLADPGSPAAISGDVLGRLITGQTSSSDHMKMLRRWLVECQSRHQECRLNLSGSRSLDSLNARLPARCISVASGNDGARHVKLVETKGRSRRYITVTHRWIQPNTAQASTTLGNYNNRLLGKDLDSLPRNFMDAFELAEKLKVPYVWIDCLCIIQDSPEDWQREARKMAKYYQGSLFTVMGFGISQEVSMFTAYHQNQMAEVSRLPYRDKEGNQQGYFYICPTDEEQTRRDYLREIASSELLTRGWVFQEWILSRRIVCFTKSGCFYQCRRISLRDATENSIDMQAGRLKAADFLKSPFRLDGVKNVEEIFDVWKLTIHIYSGLHLTNSSEDRLAALAGVAREFRRAIDRFHTQGSPTKSNYLSGLWDWDIWTKMMWEVNGTHPGCRLDGIPTWSWASISHSVVWPNDHYTDQGALIRLIDKKQTSTEEQKQAREGNLHDLGAMQGSVSQEDQLMMTKLNPLVLEGKFLHMRVWDFFGPDSDREFLAEVTGHKIHNTLHKAVNSDNNISARGQANWRRVSLRSVPEAICGWASLEDPEANKTTVPLDLVALPIHTNAVDMFGFGFGNLKRRCTAYTVLFLERTAEDSLCFKRIGIGRLFQSDVQNDMESAVMTKFWLV